MCFVKEKETKRFFVPLLQIRQATVRVEGAGMPKVTYFLSFWT